MTTKKTGRQRKSKTLIKLSLTAAEILACLRISPTTQHGIIHLIHQSPTYAHSEENNVPKNKPIKRRRSAHRIPVKIILTANQITILLRFGETPQKGLLALITQKDNTGKGRANGKGFKRGEYNKWLERRNTLAAWQNVQNAKLAKKNAKLNKLASTNISQKTPDETGRQPDDSGVDEAGGGVSD